MDTDIVGVGSVGAVDPPAAKPPIEVRTGEERCVVREFQPDSSDEADDGVISEYRNQRKAEQAVTKQLSNSRYPCALYWETDTSVGSIHWNDLFEHLRVEYSPFLRAWKVVPAEDHFMFCSVYDFKQACRYAKSIQHHYEFKHLEIRSREGDIRKLVDHRFLRQSITESGVQFDP
ncbi:MAG: hypothetical protein A07HN63_01302 [uncultured archaeon A07HN63]|nr:MAG: hypothetical protein A07HN63_01302 [uncultured archaeon A07HN63]